MFNCLISDEQIYYMLLQKYLQIKMLKLPLSNIKTFIFKSFISKSHSKKSIYATKKSLYLFSSDKRQYIFLQKLNSGEYYQVLGYSSDTNITSLTDNQIKRQYLAMIKKYHSDGVIDQQQKLQNQQITKCIISAYDLIMEARKRSKIDAGVYQHIYKDQDEVAIRLFGKKFNQIKYQLYKNQNIQKKNIFLAELEKIRKQSKNYQYKPKNTKKNQDIPVYTYSSPTSESNKSLYTVFGIGGSIVLLIIWYEANRNYRHSLEKEQRNKNKLTLSEQKKKQIQKKSMELYDKKLNDLIHSFTDQQPPSLKLSNKKDPDQLEQLIQLTIAPDINLFEVPAQMMANKQNLQKMKKIKNLDQIQNLGIRFDTFQLSKIKPNSFITLSLQAERCLQNIYIKVKDVVQEIQQTGKYTPPKIFFKFYGYIMFQIRQKPLSLQNYRNTQYISLFDLFFDYYSPIPLKRHEYNQYLVGFQQPDEKMFGQVHLNHRKIPERFITKADKVVVMRDQISESEQEYKNIWNNFYNKYQRIWKRENPGRISTQYAN